MTIPANSLIHHWFICTLVSVLLCPNAYRRRTYPEWDLVFGGGRAQVGLILPPFDESPWFVHGHEAGSAKYVTVAIVNLFKPTIMVKESRLQSPGLDVHQLPTRPPRKHEDDGPLLVKDDPPDWRLGLCTCKRPSPGL